MMRLWLGVSCNVPVALLMASPFVKDSGPLENMGCSARAWDYVALGLPPYEDYTHGQHQAYRSDPVIFSPVLLLTTPGLAMGVESIAIEGI
jgi:hypothetical protein